MTKAKHCFLLIKLHGQQNPLFSSCLVFRPVTKDVYLVITLKVILLQNANFTWNGQQNPLFSSYLVFRPVTKDLYLVITLKVILLQNANFTWNREIQWISDEILKITCFRRHWSFYAGLSWNAVVDFMRYGGFHVKTGWFHEIRQISCEIRWISC